MVKIISFEGGIGSGKTSLTNYFSHRLKLKKILESYEINPFLKEFYEGESSINLETEITFLLIHFSQIKKTIKNCKDPFVIADFSIEKDLVFAKLNLTNEELIIFKNVYDYIIKKIETPYLILYLNLSLEVLKQRRFQRGRDYEMNADSEYFRNINENIFQFFRTETKCKIHFFNIDNLEFNPNNKVLNQIESKIIEEIKL